MISILKDILAYLGVPGKIIGGILLSSLIAIGAVTVDRAVNKRETALQTSVQYIPKSQRMDSMIYSNVVALKSALDTLKTDVRSVRKYQEATNKVNTKKFELIIEGNTRLKSSFDVFDSSLDWIKQSITGFEKKKWIPFYCLSDNIILK